MGNILKILVCLVLLCCACQTKEQKVTYTECSVRKDKLVFKSFKDPGEFIFCKPGDVIKVLPFKIHGKSEDGFYKYRVHVSDYDVVDYIGESSSHTRYIDFANGTAGRAVFFYARREGKTYIDIELIDHFDSNKCINVQYTVIVDW